MGSSLLNDDAVSTISFLVKFCLGLIIKWDLWKHQLTCEYKPHMETNEHNNKQVQLKAKLMLATHCQWEQDFEQNYCSNNGLAQDSQSRNLDQCSEKTGRERCAVYFTELAHLVEGLMLVQGSKHVQLSDFLMPEKFDTIVKAVRNIAGFSAGSGHLQVVIFEWSSSSGHSIANFKMDFSLHKCSSILSGQFCASIHT